MQREMDVFAGDSAERSASSEGSLGQNDDRVSDSKLATKNWRRRTIHWFASLPRRIVDYFGAYLLIQLTYFLIVSFMASWIYYVAEFPGYLDSLFTVVSAITCTGLITIDTSLVPFGGQFMIWLLILIGSSVLNSAFPLFLRLYRFQRVLWDSRDKKCDIRWVVIQRNAVVILLVTVFSYYFFVQLVAALFLIIYSRADQEIIDIFDQQGPNYVWGSFFYSVSAFNNAGFAIFSSNLIPFSSQWVWLTVVAILILLGNTCFPIALRVWFAILRVVSFGKSPAINLLHRKPRAYYTHLFNFRQTMVLVVFIVSTLILQFVLTTALDFDYSGSELAGLSAFYKIWNVIFQSISTRNAGFNSVNIALSSSAVLWLYVILMFVAAFPVAASIRSTTRSKRVSGKEALMTLVIRDLSFCSISILLLLIVQYDEMRHDPNFSIFSMVFEVASAFGNVGLSLGYGSDATSFSGRFNTLGKLIIIAVMMAGKHRSLATSGDIALAGERETLEGNINFMADPTKADSSDSDV